MAGIENFNRFHRKDSFVTGAPALDNAGRYCPVFIPSGRSLLNVDLSAGLLCVPGLIVAPPDVAARLDGIDRAVRGAQSAGDNAWMLVSAALVLMMTGPGLALFYGGLVRRKNVLGTMMQSFILMAVVSVLWAVVGYSLVFGEGSPVIGGFHYAFLNGVGNAPNADYAGTNPQQTFMIYQLMFAIITPALISVAFAERMKYSAKLLFTI
jgi:Amt family ammonium transporter